MTTAVAESPQPRVVDYNASPTLARFHHSNAFYRAIRGPVRSGKSTAACMEIFRRACEQARGPDGVRRTKWVIVRNTYGELRDTTLATWLLWFPDGVFGRLRASDMNYHLHPEGMTDVDALVMFRALDRPEDVAKILSLEVTGAWINEAREVPKSIIDALGDRVGQYPPKKDGGCTWRGVIMDTNPPDTDSWYWRMAEEEAEDLDQWAFFTQPGGLVERNGKFLPNPEAENLDNLEENYYTNRMQGKTADHIRVYYCNKYGFVIDGKPVIGEYADDLHCAKEPLEANPKLPIYSGLDWGLTPAAVLGQKLPNGRWTVIDELVTEDMGAERFGQLYAAHVKERYPGFKFANPVGDPAGDIRSQAREDDTCFKIFNAQMSKAGLSIRAVPASSNVFTIRRESLSSPLMRYFDKGPGLLISPTCTVLRKALMGGYCYRRLKVSGLERFRDVPEKNKYSHPAEALEYMLLGAGEGALLTAIKRHEEELDESDFELSLKRNDGRSTVTGY